MQKKNTSCFGWLTIVLFGVLLAVFLIVVIRDSSFRSYLSEKIFQSDWISQSVLDLLDSDSQKKGTIFTTADEIYIDININRREQGAPGEANWWHVEVPASSIWSYYRKLKKDADDKMRGQGTPDKISAVPESTYSVADNGNVRLWIVVGCVIIICFVSYMILLGAVGLPPPLQDNFWFSHGVGSIVIGLLLPWIIVQVVPNQLITDNISIKGWYMVWYAVWFLISIGLWLLWSDGHWSNEISLWYYENNRAAYSFAYIVTFALTLFTVLYLLYDHSVTDNDKPAPSPLWSLCVVSAIFLFALLFGVMRSITVSTWKGLVISATIMMLGPIPYIILVDSGFNFMPDYWLSIWEYRFIIWMIVWIILSGVVGIVMLWGNGGRVSTARRRDWRER